MPGPVAVTSETQIGYVAEVTPGVTPATPAFKLLPITSDNFDPTIDFEEAQTLDPSGNNVDSVQAKGTSAGSIGAEMTHDSFDEIIEAFMRGTWAADVLKNGTTTRTFTFESKMPTNPTPYYKRRTGVQFGGLSIDMKAGSKITAQIDCEGMDATEATAIIVGATYAAPVSQKMMAAATVGALTLHGITGLKVPSLKIQMGRNLRAQYCLGSLYPTGHGPGQYDLTIEADVYMRDSEYTLLTNYRNSVEAASSLTFGSTAAKKYTLAIPRSKIVKLGVPVPGGNQDLMAKITIKGYLNAGIAATATLTRNVA